MSHTTQISGGVSEGGTSFVHNGDFSGEARIVTPSGELEVPGVHLLEFAARIVRDQRIARLESAGVDALLSGEV